MLWRNNLETYKVFESLQRLFHQIMKIRWETGEVKGVSYLGRVHMS